MTADSRQGEAKPLKARSKSVWLSLDRDGPRAKGGIAVMWSKRPQCRGGEWEAPPSKAGDIYPGVGVMRLLTWAQTHGLLWVGPGKCRRVEIVRAKPGFLRAVKKFVNTMREVAPAAAAELEEML